MLEEKMLVNGPLHPDLFGGFSPLKMPIDREEADRLAYFKVCVSWFFYSSENDWEEDVTGAEYRLIAASEDEAEKRAMAKAMEAEPFFTEDFWVNYSEDLTFFEGTPSEDEKRAYFERQFCRETRHD